MNTRSSSSSKPTNEWSPPDGDFSQKIASLVAGLPVAMLATATAEGSLRSRPMAAVNHPSENGEVWFFTNDDTPKTAEIAAEHEVNLSYADPERQRYLSLSGVAAILRDPARVRRFWNESADAWFPGGPDDANLVLLRVRIHTAQAWNASGKCETIAEHRTEPSPSSAASGSEAEVEAKMRRGR